MNSEQTVSDLPTIKTEHEQEHILSSLEILLLIVCCFSLGIIIGAAYMFFMLHAVARVP